MTRAQADDLLVQELEAYFKALEGVDIHLMTRKQVVEMWRFKELLKSLKEAPSENLFNQ